MLWSFMGVPNKYFAASCFLNMFKDSLTKTVCLKVFCNLLCKYRPEHPMPIPRNPAMPISVWLEGHFIVTNIIHTSLNIHYIIPCFSNLQSSPPRLVNIIQYLNKVLQLLSLP